MDRKINIPERKKKKEKLSTAQIITLGFAGIILIGGLLLWMPFCAAPGQHTSFIDAMFTSTTCVCVTGLVTVSTATHWSLIGKIIILILIQLGGIGIISLGTCGILLVGKRVTIRGRKMIQEAYNLENPGDAVKMLKRILFSIAMAEAIGAVFYSFIFVPKQGMVKGISQAVFTAVSAFCNAGIDLIGDSSLMPYKGHIPMNLITIGLIIVSGLGFSVWWDIKDQIKEMIHKRISLKKALKGLSLQSKMVLTMTSVLVLGGAVLIFIFEYGNPETIGNDPLGTKIIASLFQSVTTRTAGFLTIDQAAMTEGSTLLSLLYMVIGGSPMGTAGGVKTTTFLVLILSVIASMKGKRDVEVFHRKVKDSYLRSAVVIVTMAIVVDFVMTMLLCTVSGVSLADAIYEITSAVGTVGLTRGITSILNTPGKLVVMLTMYLGRIGPLTLGMAVLVKGMVQPEKQHLAEETIMIG